MSEGQSDDGFSKERAELFEALGHPMRLEILRALSESPLGFADLKRKMNVSSSGHLAHHLEKLDGLVRTTPEGLYALTDEGKEALRIVSVSKDSASHRIQDGRKLVISRAVLAGLVAALLLLASVAVIQELELTDLGNRQSSQNQPFPIATDFNSSVLQLIGITLTPAVSEGQNVTVSVEVYNPLEQGLQVTGYPMGTSDNVCGNSSPVNARFYLGYFTLQNISEGGVGLPLDTLVSCPSHGSVAVKYTFYPHSDVALIRTPVSNTSTTNATAEVGHTFTMSGYYVWKLDPKTGATAPTFQAFPSGTYTVLASDIWGHVSVCYFQVVSTQPASPVSIGVEGSAVNYTTFIYANGSLSFPSSEEFPLSVSAQSTSDIHLTVVGAIDGVWAKLMPENLTSVGPAGASSILLVAGAVSPPGGGKPSNGFTLSLVASDDAGHSSVANIELIPEVHVAVLHSPSAIDLVHSTDQPYDAVPDFLQVAPYGAVYDPLVPDDALGPLQLANLSVSLQPLGILVNGSLQALPPWLQVVIPEASFNLTADVPHYFELGVKLVSAPLGNLTIAVGETIGGEDFVAYVNYTVFPQPHT